VEVDAVLAEIGAAQIPQILVWNKIDLAGADGQTRFEAGVERDEYDKVSRIFVSAQTRDGLGLLREALIEQAALFARGGQIDQTSTAAEPFGPSAASVF
jgi:GTP-binding protein HflX